jgi:NitT/TauT family transport system ATP-binding protein
MNGSPDARSTAMTDSQGSADLEPLLRVEQAKIGYLVDNEFYLAVQNVSFDILPAQTIMLLGPSGCGKSTLLKAIAGFVDLAGGSVSMRGRASLVPGPDRAVVFQEFDQLFPWRTVLDNVAYPLRRNGKSREVAEESARHHLGMMGLTNAADRYPHQLSGGMKQRVAIARALALEPAMLLMDEPFGSLDALTRSRLQRELNAIARRTQVTILFVTHSIEEAIVLGDRIVVLSHSPSVVREVIPVTDAAKRADSKDYLALRTHLRSLLISEGEEEDDVDPFFE